jgi:hypothetical protein
MKGRGRYRDSNRETPGLRTIAGLKLLKIRKQEREYYLHLQDQADKQLTVLTLVTPEKEDNMYFRNVRIFLQLTNL